jgi:hypothetical protein
MSKSYALTLNQIEKWEELLKYFKSLKSRNYIVAGQELAPSTGHPHIQIYIQFNYPIRLSIKKLCGAHIEPCYASPQRNIDYCKKDGNILIEEGKPRLGAGNAITIKEVKAMTDKDRENLSFSNYNRLQALKRDEISVLKVSSSYKNVEVSYIYGKSGVGKTKYAIDAIVDLYNKKLIESDAYNKVKYSGSYWNGVSIDNMTQVALYDDFRDYHMPPSEFIQFIDYNVNVMNIKYGFAMNNFKYIFITSIQNPYDLYKRLQKSDNMFTSSDYYDEESKEQWIRRFTEIIEVDDKGIKTYKKKKETQSANK